MPYLCLLLSGAALLLNGLATLGLLPRRDSGVFALAVGCMQLVLTVGYVAGNAAGGLLSAAGMVLFGLTYTYVGLDTVFRLGSKGLGWFCGMVSLVGPLLAAAWLKDDPLLAVLWLCWSVLWALLFASMALGLAGLDPFIGWALVLTSQVTATAPAFLGLAGLWPRSPAVTGGTAVLLTVLFVVAGVLAKRTQATQKMVRPGEPASNQAAQPSLASSGHETAP
jgi:putative amide transporter protein